MKKFYQHERIRQLNDEARMFLTDGTVFLTRGVADLPIEDQAATLEHVRTFDQFTPDNDPYGEHDFGAFDHEGRRSFGRSICYDRHMQYGSPDPSDPRVTKRVLTIIARRRVLSAYGPALDRDRQGGRPLVSAPPKGVSELTAGSSS